jgi:tRNA threonylcarbamoyladenosine biosynthesis protein TsaE
VTVRTTSVEQTRDLGAALADVLRGGDVVVLVGELGAGKTAFVQGLARGLGVTEPVVSPSFVLVREYEGRLRLAHADAYRLAGPAEFEDLGLEEVTGPDTVTAVEWGDRVELALPGPRLAIRFRVVSESERELEISTEGPEWDARRGDLEGVAARAGR